MLYQGMKIWSIVLLVFYILVTAGSIALAVLMPKWCETNMDNIRNMEGGSEEFADDCYGPGSGAVRDPVDPPVDSWAVEFCAPCACTSPTTQLGALCVPLS